jgi:hypothetical protein
LRQAFGNCADNYEHRGTVKLELDPNRSRDVPDKSFEDDPAFATLTVRNYNSVWDAVNNVVKNGWAIWIQGVIRVNHVVAGQITDSTGTAITAISGDEVWLTNDSSVIKHLRPGEDTAQATSGLYHLITTSPQFCGWVFDDSGHLVGYYVGNTWTQPGDWSVSDPELLP